MKWICTILLGIALSGCRQSTPDNVSNAIDDDTNKSIKEATVDRDGQYVISVGDSSANAWRILKSRGHNRSNIPLDTRIMVTVPTPDGGSKSRVEGMTVPYDINGRVILFMYKYSDNIISSIKVNDQFVTSFKVPKAVKQE